MGAPWAPEAKPCTINAPISLAVEVEAPTARRPARLSLLAGSVGSLAAGVGAVTGAAADGFELHAAECTPGYGALAAFGATCPQ